MYAEYDFYKIIVFSQKVAQTSKTWQNKIAFAKIQTIENELHIDLASCGQIVMLLEISLFTI